MLRFALHVSIIVILTLLTQIGGLAYVMALAATYGLGLRRPLIKLGVFVLCYAGAAFAASLIAPMLGRVPLSCVADATDRLVVRSPITCLLNRNYVTPPLRDLATALANHMDKEFPGTVTVALDANFPFMDGFPLLPHFSHADGKKLDLAYYYKGGDGAFLNGATRSPIGYFALSSLRAPTNSHVKGGATGSPRAGTLMCCSLCFLRIALKSNGPIPPSGGSRQKAWPGSAWTRFSSSPISRLRWAPPAAKSGFKDVAPRVTMTIFISRSSDQKPYVQRPFWALRLNWFVATQAASDRDRDHLAQTRLDRRMGDTSNHVRPRDFIA